MHAFITRAFQLVAFGIALTVSSQCAAQQAAAPAAEAPPADPQGGVQFALTRYMVVFNSPDADKAEKLAALWTPAGCYVDKATGQRTEGRDALAADFRELFDESPQIQLSGDVENIRVLGDDVALVEGMTTTVTPDAEPASTAYSAVFVKQEGKWLLDSVHETPLAAPETPRQALEPLAWMVGGWQDAGDAPVHTTVRWSPNEAFLIRSYSLARGGQEVIEGTQIIGWDPRSKQIRSWTFNSDGSFGEGVWSKGEDEWLVRTAQTLADGRAATATQVIKRVDETTATVQTIAKDIDGAPEPASDPVTMTRLADATAPEAAPGEPASAAAGGAAATEATQ